MYVDASIYEDEFLDDEYGVSVQKVSQKRKDFKTKKKDENLVKQKMKAKKKEKEQVEEEFYSSLDG